MDSLPEWSKGVNSSSTSASCVGSNPTAVTSSSLLISAVSCQGPCTLRTYRLPLPCDLAGSTPVDGLFALYGRLPSEDLPAGWNSRPANLWICSSTENLTSSILGQVGSPAGQLPGIISATCLQVAFSVHTDITVPQCTAPHLPFKPRSHAACQKIFLVSEKTRGRALLVCARQSDILGNAIAMVAHRKRDRAPMCSCGRLM